MLGKKIKTYLDKENIKHKDLANMTGYPMPILSAMLNDKRNIKAEEYVSICKALGVSLYKFLDNDKITEL